MAKPKDWVPKGIMGILESQVWPNLEDSLILKSDRIDRICEDRFWI